MEHEVVKIDNEHKVAQLDDGSKINYEYLINTSPLNHFLGYFEGEKFSALKNRLSYNKVLVFNLGFNKKSKLTEEHWQTNLVCILRSDMEKKMRLQNKM